MTDFPRLIEHAFPLRQASLDSVHEKNVRHGHISTLHIWPARRPLAACRAALIATLLPDPSAAPKPDGMSDEAWQKEIQRRRQELCEKIGGKVVKRVEKKKMPNGQTVERIKEETEGGILHWGRETENADTLEWFRQEIRKAYGGRAPKVLDPFAGGGAIPLEAMRLGCEATAVDINPVAWFILKCTLEYPQKLAGQTRPLPDFILHNDAFMAEFFKKAKGYGKAETTAALKRIHQRLKKKAKASRIGEQGGLSFAPAEGTEEEELQADLAWHVRAWGQWVLDRARRELAQYYPTYADFEPIKKDHIAYEHQPMRLVPLKEDGTPDIDSLNAEFTEEYLEDRRNPRWVAKPTVAYLWARTVKCKNCRATVPLLKTRWLCKKANKRVLLTMEPNADHTGVVFGVDANGPPKGGNAAQKREHDKRIGAGTMSRAGVQCPCCKAIMTMEDLRVEGVSGRLGNIATAVVAQALGSRHYRHLTEHERGVAEIQKSLLDSQICALPHGAMSEPLKPASSRSISCDLYGIDAFAKMFSRRQTLSLATFAQLSLMAYAQMKSSGYSDDWSTAVRFYLSVAHDRVVDRASMLCSWDAGYQKVRNTFGRFALAMIWDFCESVPINESSGGYFGAIELIAEVVEHCSRGTSASPGAIVRHQSSTDPISQELELYDLIITDPPYYEAISYADMSDFFFVWLKRTLEIDGDADGLTPKAQEAVQHIRADKNRAEEKAKYEGFMESAFRQCFEALVNNGRFVIVFAHKQPDAWETLVGAMIRAGFVVDGSWPIQTEMANRSRGQSSAALASSVWLVCKKRPTTARPGWDSNVLEEMKANIAERLREYWDAGIRGPDFVWAATGPALEAYSKHPVVRKANEPNATMGVGEFLNHVRRMVVDYIVGQVLTGEKGADLAAADRLDEVTAYYLLHRHDFGMDEAPVGACILYATACSLSDGELDKTWDVLIHVGSDASRAAEAEEKEDDAETRGEGDAETDDSDDDGEPAEESGGGSKVKLKAWSQRKNKSMGYEAPEGRVVPLIDRIHRVMHLWKAGDVQKVDEYLDEYALRRNELFKRVVQSLIELSANSERSLLESISNHIGAKGAVKDRGALLPYGQDDAETR